MEEHVNKSARIIMIGHSVGAYISIEMLNQNRSLEQQVCYQSCTRIIFFKIFYPTSQLICIIINFQVVKLVCVFPTIERMGETSPGKLYSFIFDWFYYPALMMVHAIDFLVPQNFRPKIVEYILGGNTKRRIPPCAHRAALSVAKPLSVQVRFSKVMCKKIDIHRTNRVWWTRSNFSREIRLYKVAHKS